MISRDEVYQLLQDLNKARLALGVSPTTINDFSNKVELDELERLATQFKELEFPQFERAIANALIKKQELKDAPGVNSYGLTISITDIRGQLNLILSAQRKDFLPALPESKPETLSGAEWITRHLEQTFRNAAAAGWHVFPPIWANQEKWMAEAMSIIGRELSAMDFNKENAIRETKSDYLSRFKNVLETGQIDLQRWYEIMSGFDCYNSAHRSDLAAKIKAWNETHSTKIDFDPIREFDITRKFVIVKTYCRLKFGAALKSQIP